MTAKSSIPSVVRERPCGVCGANEWRPWRNNKFGCAPCLKARSKAWAKANPEKVKAHHDKWLVENAEYMREFRRRTRHKQIAASRRWRAGNMERHLYNVARLRAKKTGVPFAITREDVVIPTHCPVLGIPLIVGVYGMGAMNPQSPSLDRLVPSLGYVPGNVAVISWRANRIKLDGTAAEHRAIADWMDAR
jgi:hypothetical protein